MSDADEIAKLKIEIADLRRKVNALQFESELNAPAVVSEDYFL